MTERLVRPSQPGFQGIRLWRAPSWPIGPAPANGFAVEWCGRPGEPTSYALLGLHDGADTAAESCAGDPFSEALVRGYDQVTFGLPLEYRDAVASVIDGESELRPCIAAHGRLGSSNVAFWAVGIFLRDLDDDLWSSPDEVVWTAWLRSFGAANLRAEQARLVRAMDLHRRSAFPSSVEKGLDYGEVEPVMVGADIYGWAVQVAAGSELSESDSLRLAELQDQLRRSLSAFPEDAFLYFRGIGELASAVLSVSGHLGAEKSG
ncbi:MAG: hypothetical protein GY701_02585 [Sulfitobacter sp.]|nr:hypothetical protein [Sulfitobacter sp.]